MKAYYNCKTPTSLTIPGSVTSIGALAFYNCNKVDTIVIEEGVTTLPESVFDSVKPIRVYIPLSVTTIERAAFSGGSTITDVYYPGTQAQYYAISIADQSNTQVNPRKYSNMVYHYGYSKNHTPVAHPATEPTCTNAGNTAFENCAALASIGLPKGLSNLSGRAFYGCAGLNWITIPEKVKTIGVSAFQNCVGLKSVGLPAGLENIFDSAFEGCSALASVELPSSVQSIEDFAFRGCASLVEVKLPENSKLWLIEEGAFSGCAALRRADLPASLEYVYQNAFNGCAALRAVYYGGTRTDWAEVWVYEGNEPLQAAARYYADDAVTIETPDFTGGKVTVTIHCDAGVKARAVCAMFDADGKLLSVEAVELKQGQDNVLVFDGCDPSLTVTLLAIDADSAAPLCAAMKT